MAEAGAPARLRARVLERIAAVRGRVSLAVRHLRTGARLDVDADRPVYAASLIKLPIMVEVFRQAHEGRLRHSERVRLEACDVVLGSGVLKDLEPGIELTLGDLVRLMIVVSDNTAANLLIDRVGRERVDATMAELGLGGIRLVNKLMVVPADLRETNRVTAGDVAELLAAIARGRVVSWDACRRMVEILKAQQYQERLGGRLPPPLDPDGPVGQLPRWQLANKPGSVRGVCHDAGIVYARDQEWAIAVCCEGLADDRDGPEAIADLSRLVWDAFTGGDG